MKLRIVSLSLMFLLLSAVAAWADDDPPGRVARLQYTSGSVSIQPQGTQDWVEAVINRPLTNSDNIWTDKAARAELSVGTGFLRMDSESSLTLTNINDQTVQVELHQGTLSLHIRKLYDGELYEIDTPNLAFTIQKSGDYRFDVQPEGDSTIVTVWKGEGDATGDGPAVRLRSDERMRFTGGTSLDHQAFVPPTPDGFDDWGRVRDRRLDKSLSAQYVSPDVIGSEDLDDYGYWVTAPAYGPVWRPRYVDSGWAPYRYGHWVWINPWGWTWVDDAPWGFAPFHYGRWVYYGGYWGWAPGPVYARPVYAPALVAWFGGGNWGVSFGFGGGPAYGWCPLGYGDPFIPWYRGSRNYFRNVNIHNTRITNITYVTNNYYNNPHGKPWQYANLRSPNGRTVVSQNTLVGSRPVSRGLLNVSDRDFDRAPRGQIGATPTRDSRLGVNAGRQAAVPPQRSFARPVVSRMRAPGRTEGGQTPRTGGYYPGRVQDRGNTADARPNPGRTQQPNNEEANARPGRTGGGYPGRVEDGGRSSVPRPGQGSAGRPQGNDGTADTPRRTGGFDPGRAEPVRNNPSVPRPGRVAVENEQQGRNPSPGNPEVRNVPRPPERQNTPAAPPQRFNPPANTPRAGGHPGMDSGPHNSAPAPTPRSNGQEGNRGNRQDTPRNNFSRSPGGGRAMNVPRPTGRVLPASNQSVEYRAPQSSRDSAFSGRNSGRQSGRNFSSRERYGQSSRSYSSQNQRQFSSPSYGGSRSYSSQSRGNASFGRSNSGYSRPSYGGGGSRSASSSRGFGGSRGGNLGGASHGGGGHRNR